MDTMDHLSYDAFATRVFGPIYPDIAAAILERTGIRQGKLLDLGCGGGHLGLALMEQGQFAAAFCDISPEAVALTEKRITEAGYRADFVVGSAEMLPFQDQSFDLVASRGSMPFWDDQEKAFSEIYRVLKPGGWAYVGGGLGGKKHQQRIRELMGEEGRSRCFDKSRSKSLSNEAYIRLFEKWGARYRIVENEDEGRWFLFEKGE